MTETDIYWITRLDGIRLAALLVLVSTSFADTFLAVGSIVEGRVISRTAMAVLTPLLVLAGCACMFVPSTKEMVAIKAIPAIVNNETTHRVTHEMVEAALRIIGSVGKEGR